MVSFVKETIKEKVLRCMNICWETLESQSDITTPSSNGKILKYTAQLMMTS